VVNHETSLQIEASKKTFACKDTGKERAFCLELPAIHTYHRYHMMFPASCLDTQRTSKVSSHVISLITLQDKHRKC